MQHPASRRSFISAGSLGFLGLSLRQVQGLRMGCAREIARRRDQLGKGSARMEPTSLPASVEEIVRYLRQQDEVVVQQPNGDFLLNGRFNLTLADLLARANRMRSRQNKPSFESLGGMPVGEKKSVSERTSVVLGSVGKLAPRFIKRLPTRCNPDCAKARSSSVEHCHYMAEVGGSIPSRAYQIRLPPVSSHAGDNGRLCRATLSLGEPLAACTSKNLRLTWAEQTASTMRCRPNSSLKLA